MLKIIITGPPKSGKSTIAALIANALLKAGIELGKWDDSGTTLHEAMDLYGSLSENLRPGFKCEISTVRTEETT